MLEMFRNAAKGWVAKIFLGLLVLSFAVWGITDVFRGFQAADLATIGDRSISSEEFRQQLNQTLQRLTQQTGQQVTFDDARKLGLPQKVLDGMVSTASIDALGDRLDIRVSDQAVAVDVQSNPLFHNAQGKFDPLRFRAILQQNGLSEASFLAAERQQRLRNAITSSASDNITVPKTLLEAIQRYREETRDARYFTFSVNEAEVPSPSDDDLKKHYEAAPGAYTAPEYRSIVVMKVEPADIATRIEVSEAEIQESYASTMKDYYTPERRTLLQLSFPDTAAADEAKARLDKGEDILAIAAERGVKEADITLKDWTREQFLDKAMGDAAFGIAAGAVSAPVKGSLNTAIFKAVSVTPEKQASLEEVKDKVREKLQLSRAQDEIQAIFDAVEDARAQQTKFEDIAAKAGIPVLVLPAVSAGGLDPAGADLSIPAKNEVLRAAYASDVGVENDALTLNDGYVWYEVREVKPAAVRPFEEVKESVRADYIAAKLRTLAGEKAKALIAKAGSTTRLETLAAEFGNAEIKSAKAIKRNQVSETFDGVATLALFAAPQGTLTWSLEGDGRTVRIIEVGKPSIPAFSVVSASAKEAIETAKTGLAQDLQSLQLAAVRSQARVSINEELWRQISSTDTPQP
jgi:peptidyl-prolyl cis-trans isomerase D